MTTALRLRQVWTIARLQLGRVFFSKRSFWVYLLALFPSVIFFGHGLESKIRIQRMSSRATPPAIIETIREGDTEEEVFQRAGKPINDSTNRRRVVTKMGKLGKRERVEDNDEPERRYMMYFDGQNRVDLNFEAGILQRKRTRAILNFEEDRTVFAGVFQYFYL